MLVADRCIRQSDDKLREEKKLLAGRYLMRGETYADDGAHGAVLFADDLKQDGKPVAVKFFELPSKEEKAQREISILRMLNRTSPDTAPAMVDEFVCVRFAP